MLCYIILNFNDYSTTYECANRLISYSVVDKIIVVDNKSTDESFRYLKQILNSSKIDLIQTDRNGGYGYGNNYGIRYAVRVYNPTEIVISNPDVEIEEKSIYACKEYLHKSSNNVIVAPLMKNADGSYNYKCAWKCPNYYNYLLFSLFFCKKLSFNYSIDFFDEDYFDCDCVAGSWLMIHPARFINIGMYDEHLFLYCEETAIGIRAKNVGYKTTLLPNETFLHKHSVSISKSIKSEIKQYRIMWQSRLYILDNYFQYSILKKIISRIVFSYAMMERILIQFVRFCKRKYR